MKFHVLVIFHSAISNESFLESLSILFKTYPFIWLSHCIGITVLDFHSGSIFIVINKLIMNIFEHNSLHFCLVPPRSRSKGGNFLKSKFIITWPNRFSDSV